MLTLLAITQNTLKEAFTQRLFQIILILWGFLFISISLFQTTTTVLEAKDISTYLIATLSFLSFFGTLLAVIIATQTFFSDLDHRTLITLLSKPVHRWQILLGKFLGVTTALLIFWVTNLVLITLLTLHYQSQVVEPATINPYTFLTVVLFSYLKNILIVAMTLAVCTLCSSGSLALLCTALSIGFSELQDLFKESIEQLEGGLFKTFLNAVDGIFPDFATLEISSSLIFQSNAALDPLKLPSIALYAGAYIIFFNALAIVFFHKRPLQ